MMDQHDIDLIAEAVETRIHQHEAEAKPTRRHWKRRLFIGFCCAGGAIVLHKTLHETGGEGVAQIAQLSLAASIDFMFGRAVG